MKNEKTDQLFSGESLGSFNNNSRSAQTVYVTMKQDGDLWKATGLSRTKPKSDVFLRGTMRYNRIEYGTESYFVQEGTGKAIEDAMRRDRESVIVELVIAPDGKAAIKAVHVEGQSH